MRQCLHNKGVRITPPKSRLIQIICLNSADSVPSSRRRVANSTEDCRMFLFCLGFTLTNYDLNGELSHRHSYHILFFSKVTSLFISIVINNNINDLKQMRARSDEPYQTVIFPLQSLYT